MQQNINKSLEQLTSKVGLLTVLTIAVCAAVLVAHWPALSAKALSYDDEQYFVENFPVRNPGLQSAWRFLSEVLKPSTVAGYYQPLTMISLMLDYAWGGQTDSLLPFHITSLALHIANTALIIVLLHRLFGRVWIAAAVGLLFGVHPLTVEPIPWVSERKTLLAAFFSLWSLLLYVRFAQKGGRKAYLGCIAMYVLALMSKPTATPLPVVMLLMDFWPLRRLEWRAVLEKLPFFAVGIISAAITYISQQRTVTVITPVAYGLMRAPLVICHNIIFYLYKMIWPANLSSHYAFPEPVGLSDPMVLIGVIGTCILVPLLVLSLRWTRAALTGWLIFFVTVFPTMQFFQFSNVIASDKFIYLPSFGLLMIPAAFLSWLCRPDAGRPRTARCAIIAVVVLMLAGSESFATRRYLAHWRDTISLFEHMVKVTPNAASPLNNLGMAYAKQGDYEKAIESFKKALAVKPDDMDAHFGLGKVYSEQGKEDEAMFYYNKVLNSKPKESMIYNNLAVMLVNQGRIDEAIAMYRRGIEAKLRFPSALHVGLGTLLLQQGKIDEGIAELQTAVKLQPDATAFNNLGAALLLKGKINEAMECHENAIRLDSKNAEAHYNLGNLLLSKGRLREAVDEYEKALRINPRYTKAHANLAVALMQSGRLDESIEQSKEAIKLDPNHIGAHFNMAMALAAKGLFQQAISEYRNVLRLDPADADAHCMIGDILARQGRYEEAAAEYRQALKINPQHPTAQQELNSVEDTAQQPSQTTQ